jgi:hypothetical protein
MQATDKEAIRSASTKLHACRMHGVAFSSILGVEQMHVALRGEHPDLVTASNKQGACNV